MLEHDASWAVVLPLASAVAPAVLGHLTGSPIGHAPGPSPWPSHAWGAQEGQEFGDILLGSYGDTYCNLTLKVMHSLKWVSEQCWPHYNPKMDDNCFHGLDHLPIFLAGLDPAWTGLYMGSLFYREKRQVICQPSSKWHVAQQDYHPDIYLPYASGISYVLSLDAAKKILEVAWHVHPIPVEDTYMGILVEVTGVWARASTCFAKHNEPWHVCSYHYLMVIHILSLREQEGAHRSMLQAPSLPTGSDPPRSW
ncbi:LOW QUALITY PROTEIN: beta-1,3-galactosyltransferase 5-like [Phoenicopterus ruber ruber]